QDAVLACYDQLQTQYKNMWIFSDTRGDDASKDIINTSSAYYSDVFTMASDDPLLKSTWGNYYLLIFSANTTLEKLDKADPAIVINKVRHIAEAKFLRALAYFDLVRIFGDVPKITVPVSIPESYKIARESADKIYDEIIIPDLLAAEPSLSLKYTGADVGRATKGAAKALLGKVYLTRKNFVNAEAKLQEVTTMGYSLLAKYNDLFDYTKDEHHSEYIFDIEYVAGGLGEGSPWTSSFFPMNLDYAKQLGIIGAGSGDAQLNASLNLFNAFDPLDIRRAVTVDVSGGYINTLGVFVKFTYSDKYTRKYITAIASVNDSPANWKVIRYADVLLMYAEALNENGKTTQALTYLNMVRSRAGLVGYSALTQPDARDKIYQERRFELSYEGHRWFDLVRTGLAYTVMQKYFMKPYMTVFPVPLSQIQIINNPSIFAQNPGYE
ncbi:MAG: RagB/SusD family nutrient uptake outer membrane protein, partial [Verrucomicrobiota bacterium]